MSKIKILIGGSPCTNWSICRRHNRETVSDGIGWELFRNYLIAKEKFKPDFFLYENNNSISNDIKEEISKTLGHPIQMINAAFVSAQQRKRIYVHNIPNVEYPKNKGLVVADILEKNTNEKIEYIDPYYWKGGIGKEDEPKLIGMIKNNGKYLNGKQPSQQYRIYSGNSKGICLNTGKSTSGIYMYKTDEDVQPIYIVKDNNIFIGGKEYDVSLEDGNYAVRKLTPIEAERLQTLPDDYTKVDGVKDAQRYKMIGNGWCANVIIHILSHLNIPKDTEIEILSMYDGIATGRYCFDVLGYKNIVYKSYEIDKYAIKVANKNYPDIIQCGDAFDVRGDKNDNRFK